MDLYRAKLSASASAESAAATRELAAAYSAHIETEANAATLAAMFVSNQLAAGKAGPAVITEARARAADLTRPIYGFS
jgi:hypothetical protein